MSLAPESPLSDFAPSSLPSPRDEDEDDDNEDEDERNEEDEDDDEREGVRACGKSSYVPLRMKGRVEGDKRIERSQKE